MGNKKDNPITQLLLGFFIIGLAVFSYRLFGRLAAGDNSAMSVACELFGKYLVSAYLFIIGIKTVFAGIKSTINQEEDEEIELELGDDETSDEEISNSEQQINNEPQNITVDLKNEEFGVIKTVNYKTDIIGNKIRTETHTHIDYTNYVSDVKNKQLYFETIIYLMIFIQEKDKSVDIEANKFYRLALENVDEIETLDIIELEKKILENVQKCRIQFNDVEVNSLLKNSVNILKGKFAITPSITSLYFSLFELMKIRVVSKEEYFYSLLN